MRNIWTLIWEFIIKLFSSKPQKKIEIISGNNQEVVIGEPFNPLRVRATSKVKSSPSEPVASITVSFRLSPPSGGFVGASPDSPDEISLSTNAEGEAEVLLELDEPNNYQITASSVEFSPAVFNVVANQPEVAKPGPPRPEDTLKAIADVEITAYNLALESELEGDGTEVENPNGIEGVFYAHFLYSARGLPMQGSGRSRDGRVVQYLSSISDVHWLNKNGETTGPQGAGQPWSAGPPVKIHPPENAHFSVLDKEKYPYGEGARGAITPLFPETPGEKLPSKIPSIAVDPEVIEYRSIVYIESLKEGPSYGYFQALDTGSAIKGNHIDVFVGAGEEAMIKYRQLSGEEKYSDVKVMKPDFVPEGVDVSQLPEQA